MRSINTLHQCKNIVAIGGGHGLGRVMASLSFLGQRLTGIVTTTDNGGSTGRLREASGCIGWGDLRNCLNQLCSDNPNLARVLFEYRFKKDSGELTGHNLGNLMLLAMDQMCVRPLQAVNLIRQMLQVEARLIPMSEEPASLAAMLDDRQIVGETQIDKLARRPDRLFLLPRIKPTKEAIDAIKKAETIILGPGSFMTSILPALLMNEVAQAVAGSNAVKIFIGNMKPEESPINTLSINQKLTWMKQMTRVSPDWLIWPEERLTPHSLSCRIHQAPLADPFQPGIHSQEALRCALESVLPAVRKGINSIPVACPGSL
ncbi:uridine diphosphate-N-acetylglucosamine-binding protein YvcK [Candidatus Sororendozoicomonas aggregata]|uniref:uridine diphosphate-N-acetylglucosamine-binding protein YvcK n=1 Tax=Candidatus Sororendozoicomonas aggregata TaxID=3073239 RepID=UPI002ED5739B